MPPKKNLPAVTPTKQRPAYLQLEGELTDVRNQLTKTKGQLRDSKAEVMRPKVPEALMDFAAGQMGAAALGFGKGATGLKSVMGIPVEVGGLVPVLLGAIFKVPPLIAMGGGMLAPYTADYFEELGEDLFGGGLFGGGEEEEAEVA